MRRAAQLAARALTPLTSLLPVEPSRLPVSLPSAPAKAQSPQRCHGRACSSSAHHGSAAWRASRAQHSSQLPTAALASRAAAGPAGPRQHAASSLCRAPALRRRSTGAEPGDGGAGAAQWRRLSRRLGVKRCVRPSAMLGENGLVRGAGVVFPDASGLKLERRANIVWDEGGPRTVLLVKKPNSPAAAQKLGEIAHWMTQRGLRVLVERSVHAREFPQYDAFSAASNDVDFCVTLGGDGTVLHLAGLFGADEPLPPLVSFAMGTLGFLTPFDAADFQACLERVLNAGQEPVFCTLRTRKRCELIRDGEVQSVHHVLNECLIDRGSSPNMVRLELYVDTHHITTVLADGLIIATPSGSTAYSMSAGGPMVAPSVPCALITPIAPHTLSFRPLVVPEASDIDIFLSENSRAHARASFDGRDTQRMLKGCSMRCTTSHCVLPVINLAPLDNDWYDGITMKLGWAQGLKKLNRLPSLQR